MENLSKRDIAYRLENIKTKAIKIIEKIEKNNKNFESKYSFAKNIGIKVEDLNSCTDIVLEELNKYIKKADNLISIFSSVDEDDEEKYKLLNNMLYLDDIKLKNINELANENDELKTKEYLKLISNKANELIREEEINSIDNMISKIAKINFIEKITGRAKIKRAMLENYSLKRVETMNKRYIPDNKSLYEIVSITNNCGYKSSQIDSFIKSIVEEFSLDDLENNSLALIDNKSKIPLFFNKDIFSRINSENSQMLDRINNKKESKEKISEFKMYNDMLVNDVNTLELLDFEEEVI